MEADEERAPLVPFRVNLDQYFLLAFNVLLSGVDENMLVYDNNKIISLAGKKHSMSSLFDDILKFHPCFRSLRICSFSHILMASSRPVAISRAKKTEEKDPSPISLPKI